MNHPKDFYKLFEVQKQASREEIERKWRRLCLQYSPDKSLHNKAEREEYMKILNQAKGYFGR